LWYQLTLQELQEQALQAPEQQLQLQGAILIDVVVVKEVDSLKLLAEVVVFDGRCF